ncbi:hypothetical protein [Streptomyces sp. cg35]|uniref:hypothetical protein n=1 Tax=Streptomyces sp. cg35 TaxID=3421650 RepID=UPI003D17FB9F
MSDQRETQPKVPAPRPQTDTAQAEMVKKGALTVIGAMVSGATRAVMGHFLDGS